MALQRTNVTATCATVTCVMGKQCAQSLLRVYNEASTSSTKSFIRPRYAQSLLRVYNEAIRSSTKSFSTVVRPLLQYQPPSTTRVALQQPWVNQYAQSLLRGYNEASTASTKSFSRVVRPMEQHQPPSTTKVNYYELNQTLLKSNTNILDKATYSQDNRVTGRRTSISTPAEETHIDLRNIARVTPK